MSYRIDQPAFPTNPAIIGLDIPFNRRNKFMRKYAEKLDIKGIIVDPLDND